jgi:hypothetical protein
MGKSYTFPTPTATKKSPKPKNQTAPQPKHGMGTLRKHPPHKERKNKIRPNKKKALSLRLLLQNM